MAITSVQIIYIPVRDQDIAKHFYVDILGWDLLSDESYSTPQGTLRWLEVRPQKGQTAISLIKEDKKRKAGSMDHMTLAAVDLKKTVKELVGRGVTFIHEIRTTPMANYIKFIDPDGNQWSIQEIKSIKNNK